MNLATKRTEQSSSRCAEAWAVVARMRGTRLAEQFDSFDNPSTESQAASGFSGEACDMLGATVRSYLLTGGAPEELGQVTARLCREAQARGLSAEETLAEIRATLGSILAG